MTPEQALEKYAPFAASVSQHLHHNIEWSAHYVAIELCGALRKSIEEVKYVRGMLDGTSAELRSREENDRRQRTRIAVQSNQITYLHSRVDELTMVLKERSAKLAELTKQVAALEAECAKQISMRIASDLVAMLLSRPATKPAARPDTHSWARFLVARADMIDALHRDGMSDKHIAATLSAEATQVFLIRTRDRSTDYVMRGTENEELRSQITNLRELVRKAYIEGRNHGSFAESVEDSQRRIIEGTDKRPTWETSETCIEMEDEKWKP